MSAISLFATFPSSLDQHPFAVDVLWFERNRLSRLLFLKLFDEKYPPVDSFIRGFIYLSNALPAPMFRMNGVTYELMYLEKYLKYHSGMC